MKTLYRGWSPTILRDVPFSMIYWLNYEIGKTQILRNRNENSMDNLTTFMCGAIAGSIAATITCPFDVVKTHRQIQLGETILNKKAIQTRHIFQEIYRTKGISGLFAGESFFCLIIGSIFR